MLDFVNNTDKNKYREILELSERKLADFPDFHAKLEKYRSDFFQSHRKEITEYIAQLLYNNEDWMIFYRPSSKDKFENIRKLKINMTTDLSIIQFAKFLYPDTLQSFKNMLSKKNNKIQINIKFYLCVVKKRCLVNIFI